MCLVVGGVLLAFLVLLCSAAPEYAIDPACDKHRDGIVLGVREAIELADVAYLILDQSRDDQHVQSMSRTVLGDDDTFDAKLDEIKDVFHAISQFSKEPSPFGPEDQRWTDRGSNKDVSIWCNPGWFWSNSNTMFHLIQGYPRVPGKEAIHSLEQECLNPDYDPGSKGAIKASTFSSDLVNKKLYLKDRQDGSTLRLSNPRYRREIPFANDMAICHWFLKRGGHETGWARIDYDRVSKATTPEHRDALIGIRRPVDGLRTFGVTMLHELSHTNQGLLRLDSEVEFRNGASSCYDWACITQLHDARNADTVALLAVALKVWQLGFYVDTEGNIHPKQA